MELVVEGLVEVAPPGVSYVAKVGSRAALRPVRVRW